jgi:hypothetical protein
MRQRINAAKDDCAQGDNNREESQQARHQALALIPLVPANGTEYDHVRPRQASIRQAIRVFQRRAENASGPGSRA